MVKSQHLVVDSGGFLKNADLQSMGCKIYSIQDVVKEIRDKATRQRLSFLPYEVTFKEPSPSSLQRVTNVSKETGDYPSLSTTDLKILALTYELTKQYDPASIKSNISTPKGLLQFGGNVGQKDSLPGFYMPDEKQCSDEISEVEDVIENLDIQDEEEEKNHSDGEVDEGWITPENITKINQQDDLEEMEVACITTDFAMQNVLMKLGLKVLSVDGMLIKNIRSYVLRCHACFAITKIMNKEYCPKCGNRTLKRVPAEMQEDGTLKYFLSKNPKVLNKRGKKTSLPMPQGGKHSRNPILCEDQPIPQNRLSKKALQKTNIWSDDYGIDGSPFATKDTDSRAFKLGIRHGQRNARHTNPNAVNRKFVKRR